MPDQTAQATHCQVISDFNAQILVNYLEAGSLGPELTAAAAPFGQVAQTLRDPDSPAWHPMPDCTVLWTQPQAVVPLFSEVLSFGDFSTPDLLAQVDEYAALVARAAERSRMVLVPTWAAPAADRGWGMLDYRSDLGIQAALLRMNLRLAERLEAHGNVYVLDTQRWLLAAGPRAHAPKLWFMGKVPFGNEVFAEAARDVAAAITALRGGTRKLIVVDLDNTLWGGVVGDIGWENLLLGGHDQAGEAFVEFQQALKAMTRRGIVLAIASKNTEAVALEAIRSHPEMCLRAEDFAGWRINWQDKAQNIADLASELQIGLQSVVFLDDNPVERERVRLALPEVLVPEWPKDPMLYAQALRKLNCFDVLQRTGEDSVRTGFYQAQRHRQAERLEAGDLEAWLEGLATTVVVEPVSSANLTRVVQLLNKTNQMNLRTRRLTEHEARQWTAQPGNHMWAFRVSDRLGDSGITGIAGVSIDGDTCTVADYVLSCRVMGRKLEETLLAWIVDRAREMGAREVVMEVLPTAKNAPCLEFLRRSGLDGHAEPRFAFSTTHAYPLPKAITLVRGNPQDVQL
ncbi:HAD-IIIC family phosphatase [Novilysobacter antarcticus]|uniref:HAD-IIIC family phosphatase n=1 Tax=Novilysobacter antarcticus TaxID=2862543 RepID=UPI001C997516|nr:HAD-IIIC family phosphatase [Lysobacter antarcticus]